MHHGARPDVGGLGAVCHPGGSLGQAAALVWHATEGRLDQLDRRAEHALPALEHRRVLWPARVAVGQQRPVVSPHRIKTVRRLGESADRNAARKFDSAHGRPLLAVQPHPSPGRAARHLPGASRPRRDTSSWPAEERARWSPRAGPDQPWHCAAIVSWSKRMPPGSPGEATCAGRPMHSAETLRPEPAGPGYEGMRPCPEQLPCSVLLLTWAHIGHTPNSLHGTGRLSRCSGLITCHIGGY